MEKLFVTLGAFVVVLSILAAGCWIGNVVKLTKCDFEAPYKGEIIHAAGLIPYVSIVTIWNDDK